MGTGTYADTEKQTNYVNVIPPSPLVIIYAYDGLYRLTRTVYSLGESLAYEYDALTRQSPDLH